MDLYQTAVFGFSFYCNIEFALVMVLLQRGRVKAAYTVDVVHRVLAPILLLFGTIGVFEQNEAAQQAIFTAMGVSFVMGLVGSIIFLRWRYLVTSRGGTRIEDGEMNKVEISKTKTVVVETRQIEGKEC
jgi:hypothetical protein